MKRAPAVIVRIRGGLGNQLFCYTAGRALAARNGVPLKLDATSAYHSDKFGRSFLLDRFNIVAPLATPYESYEGPVGEWRRRADVRLSKHLGRKGWPYYVLETTSSFIPQIADLRVTRPLYLDGYWQNERYFRDCEQVIRGELSPKTDHAPESLALAKQMHSCSSVSLHVRSYAEVADGPKHDALAFRYYERALAIIRERISKPQFYCFSDSPDWARATLSSVADVTFVTLNHARGDVGALEDLWLMGQCRHHIIANSAFSWWGAWLDPSPDKLVIGPAVGRGGLQDWLPDDWIGL